MCVCVCVQCIVCDHFFHSFYKVKDSFPAIIVISNGSYLVDSYQTVGIMCEQTGVIRYVNHSVILTFLLTK